MTLAVALVQAQGWALRLKMIWRLLTQGQLVLICPVLPLDGPGPRGQAKGAHLRLVEDEGKFDA